MPAQAQHARRALAGLVTLLVACIPDALVGPPDGATPADASNPVDASGTDGAAPGPDATVDSSDDTASDASASMDASNASDAGEAATSVPDGSIRCGTTSQTCPYATMECCDSVYGQLAEDGGANLGTIETECESIGGPNCGSYGNVGPMFFFNFPQTCMADTGCDAGSVCCALTTNGGGYSVVTQIQCKTAAGCASSGRTLCVTNADCPGTSCQPEADPILANLYARTCQ
jgi:hypothetical protein